MQNNQSPIDIGAFNQVDLSPKLTPATENLILSAIKDIDWRNIPFCKLEVRVREATPRTVIATYILEKTYQLG
jgi:hypothetical protein